MLQDRVLVLCLYTVLALFFVLLPPGKIANKDHQYAKDAFRPILFSVVEKVYFNQNWLHIWNVSKQAYIGIVMV